MKPPFLSDQYARPKDLVEINASLEPEFNAYAAGYATVLKDRLHSPKGVTPDELYWLARNTTGSRNPDDMCQQLIDRYTLQRVAERLSK